MSKHFSIGLLMATAAAAPLFLAAPASAEATNDKFTEVQKLGYLGQTNKSALTRSVLEQLQAQTTAPTLTGPADRVIFWHDVLLDTIALDHTPDPDTGEVPFYQGGPGRTSRALAMTMIAVYDAANAFDNNYVAYNAIPPAPAGASMDAAIAYAAHDVLVDLFPFRKQEIGQLLKSDLDQLTVSNNAINAGKQVGKNAAKAMLDGRKHDNSDDAEPSFGGGGAVADGTTTFRGTQVNDGAQGLFDWTPDPNTPEFDVLNFNVSLGAYWGAVTPFTLTSGDQFRIPPYPAPGSPEYIDAFNQVASLGGSPDNVNTPSTSTEETRFNGNFWGYDAVPLLGTPPRAYNQIAVQIVQDEGVTDAVEIARILAMVNAGIGDAGIAAWDSKYYYNYWRPVTGIRIEDGVAETTADPTWDPVGVSIVNVELPPGEAFVRPTPPFPAYPSGHATFGAATFQVLTAFFGDDTPFTFVSDEYNGEGVDPFDNQPRPLVPVFFPTLLDAQISNGISRVHNGVHWSYDDLQGQALGEDIASYIVNDVTAFQPAP